MLEIPKKLYVDFDGTIVNSIKRIVALYSEDFRSYDAYKPIHWTSIESWSFDELKAATPEQIDIYFNQPRFFDEELEWMDNAMEILGRLNYIDKFSIEVVSCGYTPNLREKKKWLEVHLPYASFTGINLKMTSSKSHIDMSDGILIDDMSKHLNESNTKIPICFGDEYPWNKDWEGVRCNNWYDVYQIVTGCDLRKEELD